MSLGLLVYAGDVAKEGVSALLGEVSIVGKTCLTRDISVHDFMELRTPRIRL